MPKNEYQFVCPCCHMKYIGKTENKITGKDEHTVKELSNTAINKHFVSCDEFIFTVNLGILAILHDSCGVANKDVYIKVIVNPNMEILRENCNWTLL